MKKVEISELGKTGLLPLWGRYFLHQNKAIAFKDDFAKKLVDSIDYPFSAIDKYIGEYGIATWGCRSLKFDAVTKNYLNINPNGVVLNMGVGLDDPFSRNDNGQALFIDCDFKDTLDFRDEFLTPNERRMIFKESFLNYNWVKSVKEKNCKNPLLLLSGVSMYLKKEEMFNLVQTFFKEFPDGTMVFDVLSTQGIKMLNSGMKKSELPQEEVHFGMKNISDFKECGLKEIHVERLISGDIVKQFSLFSRMQIMIANFMGIARLVILGKNYL